MSGNPKRIAGERAAELVDDGMIVGLGTGSTAFYAIQRLGERVREGLRIRGVPTSEQSRIQAERERIPLVDFAETTRIDLTIDGADEIDPAFNLIKGGGGALFREKLVATASLREIIVADESKLKDRLGAFPLPVEVVPFGWQFVQSKLEALGCRAALRVRENRTFSTDNGNHILDCAFGPIEAPEDLERRIAAICGVVESGLFVGLAHRIVIGNADGTLEERDRPQCGVDARRKT
ncbi:MAG: ribose-5-phosphate isomerase RpiA [Gemmatimonadota bacterium]|nr:ribose-5-phosphate isomerase RpiA [Gemmatimonadota bacterium]